jgi:hypothetical protein
MTEVDASSARSRMMMTPKYLSPLTSSHLDIKVPVTELSPLLISDIITAPSRRNLFFGIPFPLPTDPDETLSLFILFKLPWDAVDETQLDAFLKETSLALEVSITETPQPADAAGLPPREKFEGMMVYTVTLPEQTARITEKVDQHWITAWKVSVPISNFPGCCG